MNIPPLENSWVHCPPVEGSTSGLNSSPYAVHFLPTCWGVKFFSCSGCAPPKLISKKLTKNLRRRNPDSTTVPKPSGVLPGHGLSRYPYSLPSPLRSKKRLNAGKKKRKAVQLFEYWRWRAGEGWRTENKVWRVMALCPGNPARDMTILVKCLTRYFPLQDS